METLTDKKRYILCKLQKAEVYKIALGYKVSRESL